VREEDKGKKGKTTAAVIFDVHTAWWWWWWWWYNAFAF